MPAVYGDNIAGTLSAGVSTSETSLPLQTGEGTQFSNISPSLSTTNFGFVRIGTNADNEVVKITGVSTDTLTCEALAGPHSEDDPVRLLWNSSYADEFLQREGAGETAKNLLLQDMHEIQTEPASVSNVLTLDVENGNVFEVTLTENVTTLTLSNPTATGNSTRFRLILKQDGSGGHTFAFSAACVFPGGSAPTLTTAASAIDILDFMTTDGGTVWYVTLAGADFS